LIRMRLIGVLDRSRQAKETLLIVGISNAIACIHLVQWKE